MYQGALVSGFVNISVYFNKLANNFKPLDRFLKKFEIYFRLNVVLGDL